VKGSDHKDDVLRLVYFIKESPRTNSIPPGFRGIILEFLDMRSEMGMLSKLGIHKFTKLFKHIPVTRP
jgi:hypothetical protein